MTALMRLMEENFAYPTPASEQPHVKRDLYTVDADGVSSGTLRVRVGASFARSLALSLCSAVHDHLYTHMHANSTLAPGTRRC